MAHSATSSGASASRSLSPDSANRKTRLTEAEKRANHLASEKKRREQIRQGFDRLSVIVPGLEGRARSEGIVLRGTIEYIRKLLVERRRMIETLEANGVAVDVHLKSTLDMMPPWFFDDDWEEHLMNSGSQTERNGSPGGSQLPAANANHAGNGHAPASSGQL
ncbi:hypothetical protein VTG60DRAFT_5679 [Thermothelomyces hinnuleus]